MKDIRALAKSPLVWVGTTYFAEGFPYSLVRQISSVYFKDHNASLPAIGMTSLMGLPWALKFLWSPYLDEYGTKRKWLLWCEVALVIALLGFAAITRTSIALHLGTLFFIVTALLSATHDIAIDGFYLEALDKQGQARFVGYRVMAYRIAMITAAGGIVSLSQYAGWVGAFGCAALLLCILLVYHVFFLPKVEKQALPLARFFRGLVSKRSVYGVLLSLFLAGGCIYAWKRATTGFLAPLALYVHKLSPSSLIGLCLLVGLLVLLALRNRIRDSLYRSSSFYAKAFLTFLDQERIGWALGFIVLYRSGESLLMSMCVPFLMDLGINKAQYGLISGTLGIVCSILGALTGGACIARYTLKKTIWPFTLAQNLTLLLYMGLALYYRDVGGGMSRSGVGVSVPLVACVHCFEQFAAGLGTAVFSYYLMRCCRPEFKASHFAIVSGIMNIGGSLFGVVSGFLAELLGYWRFFGLSFVASIPGMLLICFIPFLDDKKTS